MKYIIVIAFFIELVGCDPMTKKLELVNNSDKVVYSKILIDTSYLDIRISKSLRKILPHHSYWPTLVSGKGEDFWENYINRYSNDSTLYIYFFNTNQVDESILNDRKYKRFDLRVKDLEELNWTVNYK